MTYRLQRLVRLVAGACAVGFLFAAILPAATLADDAPPAAPPAAPTAAQPSGSQTMLARAKALINECNLTAEQKPKVEAIFTRAGDGLAKLRDESAGLEPRERAQKFRDYMSGVRNEVMAVLTDEQRKTFEEKMTAAQDAARAGGPGVTQVLARLEENLAKLDLNDDQKKKVADALADAKQKLAALRAEAQPTGQAGLRELARPIQENLRTQLQAALSDAQQAKLKEMMAAGATAPGSK